MWWCCNFPTFFFFYFHTEQKNKIPFVFPFDFCWAIELLRSFGYLVIISLRCCVRVSIRAFSPSSYLSSLFMLGNAFILLFICFSWFQTKYHAANINRNARERGSYVAKSIDLNVSILLPLFVYIGSKNKRIIESLAASLVRLPPLLLLLFTYATNESIHNAILNRSYEQMHAIFDMYQH